MAQLFLNNVTVTLEGAIDDNDTALTLEAGEGSILPAIASPDYVLLTMAVGFGGTETAWEIVKVVAHTAASTSITVERAQEGTTGLSWADGTKMQARFTKGSVELLQSSSHFGKSVALNMGLVRN
jgi:hypothetical protein